MADQSYQSGGVQLPSFSPPQRPLVVNGNPEKRALDELNCDSELELVTNKMSGVRLSPVGTPFVKRVVDGEYGGHYVVILKVRDVSIESVREKFQEKLKFSNLDIYSWIPVKFNEHGDFGVHMCLDRNNQMDAVAALARAAFGLQIQVEYTTRREFTFVAEMAREVAPMHEGQVVLVAQFYGSPVNTNEIEFQNIIMEALINVAQPDDILSMKVAGGLQQRRIECRVEFETLAMAEHCIAELPASDPKRIKGWSIHVMGTEPRRSYSSTSGGSATDSMPGSANQQVFISPSGRSSWIKDASGHFITLPPQTVIHESEVAGPQGFSTAIVHQGHHNAYYPSEHQSYNPGQVAIYNPGQLNVYNPGQLNVYSPGQRTVYYPGQQLPLGPINSQTLDMRSIQNGGEMRTTVMLRNLPNSWKLDDVKAFIDVHVFGRYDFMYIRMDFAKDTNVGYGFVNFVHPGDVVTLVEALDGRAWVEGRNRRRVGLSYATVQGIECLREKFRNSAVMCENPNYRPQLFWAYDDVGVAIDSNGQRVTEALVGTVKDFPFCNNQSKQARSIDNAQHQGLFGPNRPRRFNGYNSCFDRGIRQNNYSLANNHSAAYHSYTPQPLPMQPGFQSYHYNGGYSTQYGNGQFADATPAYFGFNGA